MTDANLRLMDDIDKAKAVDAARSQVERAFGVDSIARHGQNERIGLASEALDAAKTAETVALEILDTEGPMAGQYSCHDDTWAQVEGIIRFHGRQVCGQHRRRHLAILRGGKP